ncbi:hypothetical protein [Hoeflea poritis]|uniref:Glycosyltransferase n=1 Tax=Hoeflea poritis TaxID=2993659 RepID=A0ABT4VRZ9_9HYPH|nr:hypothetical protein [Hoeflea poritis]MDA4847454.1 hypothetical protein [Hoeflea poritis]
MTLRVASFTSIPPRFKALGTICRELKNQSVGFDHIILNIPTSYRRFPEWGGTLPNVPRGIEVNTGFDDLGPATKVLPTARLFANEDARIFHCDDDRHLHDGHVERLFDGLEHAPHAVIAASTPPVAQFGLEWVCAHPEPHARFKWGERTIAYRAARLMDIVTARTRRADYKKPFRTPFYTQGFGDIAEGLAGVLCHSSHFDETAFSIPDECWHTDDIWLSATYARRGITVWNPGNISWPATSRSDRLAPLHKLRTDVGNQFAAHCKAVRYVSERFGIWRK